MISIYQTFRAILLAGAASAILVDGAFAQSDTAASDAPKKHRHHHEGATNGSDRLDLLEKRVEEQSEQIAKQADEIQTLRAEVGQPSSTPQVSAAEFDALQHKVDNEETESKKHALVSFTSQTPFQRSKNQPTISSRDGRWTISPFVFFQGDYASYSKGQPLPLGTDNLKSSGENFPRARIGFNGTFAGDFGYSFVYDFGGYNGDETYQAYAGSSSSTSTYTTSTGAGTGSHLYNAWINYKGILDPFSLKIGVMAPPANLGDATQSDDLLFLERPSPSQVSRQLAANDSREAAGFVGYGSFWNASLFLTGDTYGKGALIAPATGYGGSQESFVSRVAFLPWHDPDNNFNVHLGANFSDVIHPQETTSTTGATTYNISFYDRPEIRVDNVEFLNTNNINAASAYTAGFEAAASYGPVLIQGENFWYGVDRRSPTAGQTNPTFSGWYVEGTVSLTGDPHPYNIANASFTRPSPSEPFDPANGYWGAWELAGRYSSTDLDYHTGSAISSDRVFGGVQNIATFGINFYPNDFLRFVLDWQDVTLKDIGAVTNHGGYNAVSFRTQVSF